MTPKSAAEEIQQEVFDIILKEYNNIFASKAISILIIEKILEAHLHNQEEVDFWRQAKDFAKNLDTN
jgi:hypothetical protein